MKIRGSDVEYYHVYNRGVDKRIVFNDAEDYERFQVLLYICNSTNVIRRSDIRFYHQTKQELFNLDRGETLIGIHSYTLLSNHFHMLVSEKGKSGLSKFMQKIMTAYTMYFNRKYNRSGSLYQGTYKSSHIENHPYVLYLFAYIHGNIFPMVSDNKIFNERDIEKVMNYPYSSILDYRDIKRPENNIIDFSFFKEEFGSNDEAIENHLKTWLLYHNKPPEV